MRRGSTLRCVCLATALAAWVPAHAQTGQAQPSQESGNAADAQKLLRIIEAQQRQLDAQQEQLKAQDRALQELREQVQALKQGAARAKPAVAEASATIPGQVPGGGTLPRRADIHTRARESAQPDEEWKGSFALKGLDTRFKLGGFVQLNAIHDTHAITTPGEFVTSAIVTGNATKAQGADGQTSFSVQPTRLSLETRTPFEQRRLTTFVSVDAFGDSSSTSPDLRLRQAYGEMNNILLGGDVLLGQAWSTFSNLEAFPNTLDFEGPNSFFGVRQPLIRWSRGVGDGLKAIVAVETPNKHSIEGADSLTAWPDGVLAMTWERGPLSLKGALLARDLRASLNNGPTATAFGWGGSVSGKIRMPASLKQDFMTFSLTYGKGIGGAFNDGPPDAAFDSATNSLVAIPTFGWFASYEHWWTPKLYSTFVYGSLDQDNQGFQPANAFQKTQYASGNLVWMPFEQWLFGVEFLYGTREDKNGADGADFRTQFTSKFTFP